MLDKSVSNMLSFPTETSTNKLFKYPNGEVGAKTRKVIMRFMFGLVSLIVATVGIFYYIYIDEEWIGVLIWLATGVVAFCMATRTMRILNFDKIVTLLLLIAFGALGLIFVTISDTRLSES